MGKRGVTFGNQNGRKHGLYSKFLTETEKQEMELAEGIEGLDDELALLRVKLCRLLENNPDRIDLHINAIIMISRLVKTRHSISPEDHNRLRNAISNVLTEVVIPLGLTHIH